MSVIGRLGRLLRRPSILSLINNGNDAYGPRPRLFGSHFEMQSGATFALFVVSLSVALFLYWSVQRWAQYALVEAYRSANVIGAIFDDHVAFDRNACDPSLEMSFQQIHALLTEAGVVGLSEFEPPERTAPTTEQNSAGGGENDGADDGGNDDDSDNDAATTTATAWWPVEHGKLVDTLRRNERTATRNTNSALELIHYLSQRQCAHTSIKGEVLDPIKEMAYLLADAVGGADHPWANRCARAGKRLDALGGSKKDKAHGEVDRGLSGFRFSTSRCVSDAEILTALGIKSLAIAPEVGYNLTHSCTGRAYTPAQRFRYHEGFTAVQQYLLGVTHAVPEVRAARKWANLVRGPEHVGILSLGLFVALVLTARTIAMRIGLRRVRRRGGPGRTTEAWRALAEDLARGGEVAERRLDAVARGRTLVRWAVATVPAVGFIGTVRGILNALAQAGDVVWAGDRLGRADAIGQLAGELGLAFSTTLFALLVGILVSLLTGVNRAHEQNMLDALAGCAGDCEDK